MDTHEEELLMYKKCKPLLKKKKTAEISILLPGDLSDEEPPDFKDTIDEEFGKAKCINQTIMMAQYLAPCADVYVWTCRKPPHWDRSL